LEVGFTHSAEWLVRVDDDVYVDTELIENALARFGNSESPVILGISVGCGGPCPGPGCFEPLEAQCPVVAKHGGLCGGGGYVINRAAAARLQSVGWLQVLKEYQDYHDNGIWYGDLVTSCVFAHHGVEIRELYGQSAANPVRKMKSWETYLEKRPLTYHKQSPDLMRWIHAKLSGASPADVTALEAKAFEKGCCCWQNEDEKTACLEDKPEPVSLSGTGAPKDDTKEPKELARKNKKRPV